jgi:hypothetical protein
MPKRISRRHREALDHNERPPDPAEAADRPLEDKARPNVPETDRDPHHVLNRPVGEPAQDADSDPYGE